MSIASNIIKLIESRQSSYLEMHWSGNFGDFPEYTIDDGDEVSATLTIDKRKFFRNGNIPSTIKIVIPTQNQSTGFGKSILRGGFKELEMDWSGNFGDFPEYTIDDGDEVSATLTIDKRKFFRNGNIPSTIKIVIPTRK